MIIDLTGKTAFVSGSTGGIGRAIAEGLARAGASVLINGRGEDRVARALLEMRALLPDATIDGIAADLATPEGATAVAARTPAVDILVNNFGTANPKPFGDLTDADWLDLFQLNFDFGR
jgi:NAD(P)-dependent dehydrogenase (short-subunit alcohol dehydrogenase family)